MATFDKALLALKEGYFLHRTVWNDKRMEIALRTPDEKSDMHLPYIYMITPLGDHVPWLATQSDLLADDWEFNVG